MTPAAWGGRAPLDRQARAFFRADGEIGLQTQEIVAGVDELGQAGLFEADGSRNSVCSSSTRAPRFRLRVALK